MSNVDQKYSGVFHPGLPPSVCDHVTNAAWAGLIIVRAVRCKSKADRMHTRREEPLRDMTPREQL